MPSIGVSLQTDAAGGPARAAAMARVARHALPLLVAAASFVALAVFRPDWSVDRNPFGSGPVEHAVVRSVASLLTLLGGDTGLVLLISAGALILILRRRFADAAFFLIAIAGARITGRVLKTLIDAARPASDGVVAMPTIPAPAIAAVALALLLLGVAIRWRAGAVAGAIVLGLVALERGIELVIPVSQGFDAFPSGHAVGSMALVLATLVLGWENRDRHLPLLIAGTLFVIGVGASRIYVGVHHPADVLAGWCVAVAWVCGTALVWRSFARTHEPWVSPASG